MRKSLNKLLGSLYFPISIKLLILLVLPGLLYIGVSVLKTDPILIRQLSKTNLTIAFVWDIWWPLIMLSAIIFGRVWCMVCPVELVTTLFAKIGLKRRRPRWILSGWGITVFYTIIVIVGITILEIDFNPVYTASYLMIIIVIAILSGFIFEKNTFCRYLCPVGYLLGLFSKMAIWGWRVKNRSVCKSCLDRSCINKKYLYQINYKSCGVDIVPGEIKENDHCILCAGCLKACKTYQLNGNSSRPNPAIVKIGFANDLFKIKPIRIVEWVFLCILCAHLIDEMTEFKFVSGISNHLIPENLSSYLSMYAGGSNIITFTVFLFLLLPCAIWILPYLPLFLARTKISLKTYLGNFSLVYLPVIVSMFVGLIVMEITTRLPYLRLSFHDVKGIDTIRAILTKQITVERLPLWTEWLFPIILILSVVFGIMVSTRLVGKLARELDKQKYNVLLYLSLALFIVVFIASVLLFECV